MGKAANDSDDFVVGFGRDCSHCNSVAEIEALVKTQKVVRDLLTFVCMWYTQPMTQNRTVQQKVGDALFAYEHLRAELTPTEMRALIDKMTKMQPGEKDDIAAYASLVNASLQLARVVSANDRAAMLSAAMITQSGVSRPTISLDEE